MGLACGILELMQSNLKESIDKVKRKDRRGRQKPPGWDAKDKRPIRLWEVQLIADMIGKIPIEDVSWMIRRSKEWIRSIQEDLYFYLHEYDPLQTQRLKQIQSIERDLDRNGTVKNHPFMWYDDDKAMVKWERRCEWRRGKLVENSE